MSRDRDKKVAIACGLGVLAVAGLIVLSWDGLRAWYVGYRFVWLPEGAFPATRGQPINASGEVAVYFSLGPEGTRAGRWSLATREVLLLDVPLAGGESSMVSAISDAGEIFGYVSRGGVRPPFLWTNDARVADLAVPGGDPLAIATSFNDRGQVDMFGYFSLSGVRSFLWTKDARVTDLAVPGGDIVATAINDRGQVVGMSTRPPNKGMRAFRWSAESGMIDLGSLARGRPSVPSAINKAGWVIGSGDAANGTHYPFLWKPETGGMQDLGLPSGFSGGHARHINDQGEVLVTFYAGVTYAPFLWREKDGLVKLPVPAGFNDVRGAALNNRGMVLLQARPSDSSPERIGYLIVNGVLKELPGVPGAKSTWYYGLNDKGWLVGVAEMKDGGTSRRGFVALPMR